MGTTRGSIHVFDAEGGEPLRVWNVHIGPVTGLAFAPDGQRLASVSQDETCRIWRLDDEHPQFDLLARSALQAVCWDSSGDSVVAATEDHVITLGSDGLWTAYLGQEFGIHRDLMDDTARWLEVAVTPPVGPTETFDRIKFASAPFALEAAQLDGKNGLEYLAQEGILVFPGEPRMRLATHRMVTSEDIDQVLQAFRRLSRAS